MKIAVIGTGISGMVAAYLLREGNDLVVFEANDYIGGHSHTVPVNVGGNTYEVDTGFIVFNNRNYPDFSSLLERLGVESQPSDMSFGVRCEGTGLEYRATSLNTLFSQRRNLLRPSHYRMIFDIIRFNRESRRWRDRDDWETTLGDFLAERKYSPAFVERFILPMASAIWSASPGGARDIPLGFFARFFHNHGFLDLRDQPEWRTVRGGSQRYVAALTAAYRDRIRRGDPVIAVRRLPDRVEIRTAGGAVARADAVVIAAHSDQALAMLEDPSPREREILGAIPYRGNEVVLHLDSALLPRNRNAWASWNAHVAQGKSGGVAVTYWMNKLQSINAPADLCVTLNRTAEIDPNKVLFKTVYRHPVYTGSSLRARGRKAEINGVNRTWYCGAYWGNGFHEDGVVSALEVCRDFGRKP